MISKSLTDNKEKIDKSLESRAKRLTLHGLSITDGDSKSRTKKRCFIFYHFEFLLCLI